MKEKGGGKEGDMVESKEIKRQRGKSDILVLTTGKTRDITVEYESKLLTKISPNIDDDIITNLRIGTFSRCSFETSAPRFVDASLGEPTFRARTAV